MEIKVRPNGKYVEFRLKDQNIDFDSGLMSPKEAELFIEIFTEAAEDLKREIYRIKTNYDLPDVTID